MIPTPPPSSNSNPPQPEPQQALNYPRRARPFQSQPATGSAEDSDADSNPESNVSNKTKDQKMSDMEHPSHIVKNYIERDDCHRGYGYGGGDCGFGGGGIIGLAIAASLFGGRRGGVFGGDGDGHCGNRDDLHGRHDAGKILDAIGTNKVLDAVGTVGKDVSDTKALLALEIAKSGHSVSKDVAAAANAISGQLDRNKDLNVAGFALVKEGQCEIKTEVLKSLFEMTKVVKDDGEKTRELVRIDILDRKNDRIRELETKLAHQHGEHRSDINKLEVTQTVNQVQAQAQQQQQKQDNDRLFFANLLHGFADQFAVARATNVTKQFGTGNVATPSNANSAVNQ